MEELKKLIDVKSIVTIILTLIFAYLSIIGVIKGDQFLTIFTMIISFYYGTQYQKRKEINEEEPQVNDSEFMTKFEADAKLDDIYLKLEDLENKE